MTTAAAAAEEEWMELAARDDHVVAELLLRLCRAAPSSSKPAAVPGWTVRQPRSGGPKKKDNDNKRRTKKTQTTKQKQKQKQNQQEEDGVEPTRASPTTPLSWSGATSTSGGGADGPEESSRPARPPYNARSKASMFTATATSTTPMTKRPKRKKTLAELKDEESLLLKERRNLRHQLATLRLTVEQERAKNEIFKQKKLDVQLQHTETIAARDMKAECEPRGILPKSRDNINVATQQNSLPDNISGMTEVERPQAMFELPDLNLPLDEHCGPQVLNGAS
ncbi:uncharacterized protein LOC116201760 [Punica granatum]|uniref:Uncharacterized protein n=2 Tax=Punica granatum TaxID=22663 RepID=A0A2I0HIP2_PUNGR|nr:uncharacterized protein LOC116201760 [Punica granatum]PKI31555.1 hypothetical protein CRG98_048039 [Punica granatum]